MKLLKSSIDFDHVTYILQTHALINVPVPNRTISYTYVMVRYGSVRKTLINACAYSMQVHVSILLFAFNQLNFEDKFIYFYFLLFYSFICNLQIYVPLILKLLYYNSCCVKLLFFFFKMILFLTFIRNYKLRLNTSNKQIQ